MLSNTENPARLIVCERRGRWAAALRRELAGVGVRVWETRTPDGCRRELEASPASFVVLQLDRDAIETLRFLSGLRRDFPAARFAVVSERDQAAFEMPFREAGVVHFIFSPRRAGLLARMACRHLAQVPPPRQSFSERLWASLPWGDDGAR
ncbi:MAG: hypothetical protein JW959_00735 [Pirellulales bacterium]|nr:hypothetical protein [Pirellulales bacterium]